MTDSLPRCVSCNRQLGPEDRFCAMCGSATQLGADPDATVVDGMPAGGSGPGVADREVSIPDVMPEPAPLPEGANFNDRLRNVLGAEYELLSLIGQGGFARVYKARDTRLDRIVAIKVIRPDLIGKEMFVESFRNEGVALAKLRHPGIIPIYDIRERGGLIYYIMPFVQGTPLDARLDRSRLPPYESRRILSELTDALAAAHRAKMVHLDIKPDNVFLEGDLQKVLLMDFGIATAVTDQIEEGSGGPVVGTPSYMSPEQAQGLPEIDHRSDIYSLGALGYKMLMGRPPFSGKDGQDILKKHVTEQPVHIRDVNPTIPKDFADAIMKCLEKDPWERFSTAKELEAALLAVEFATTRRSTQESAEPSQKPSGMNPNLVIVIAVVALVVGIVVGRMIS